MMKIVEYNVNNENKSVRIIISSSLSEFSQLHLTLDDVYVFDYKSISIPVTVKRLVKENQLNISLPGSDELKKIDFKNNGNFAGIFLHDDADYLIIKVRKPKSIMDLM